MTSALLVINAGSSSLKFQLFDNQESLPLLARGTAANMGKSPSLTITRDKEESQIPLSSNATHEDALAAILEWIETHGGTKSLIAAGHRIAHGGADFRQPIKVTPVILSDLKKLTPLAPLHQIHNLAPIEILAKLRPGLPQIACFDTSFHADMEPLFTTYALPQSLRDKGIRRFGFHGLSYEWIAQTLFHDHPQLASGRVVVAHLGNGSSLCAIKNGKSVDTTMGFTPLEGVPMGTRSGSIDPGILIHMQRELGLTANEIEHCLYEESGLKGLSGITYDVKSLLESEDLRAQFALNHFVLKVAQHAAFMTTAMGGIDAMIFTGGIGENAGSIRDSIIQRLQFLGNFPVIVIAANEERVVAQHVQALFHH